MRQIGALFSTRRHFRQREQHVQEYVRGAEVLVAVTCTDLKESGVGVQMQRQVEAHVCGRVANDRDILQPRPNRPHGNSHVCECV